LRRRVAPERIEVDHDRVVPAFGRRPALGQGRARGGEHHEGQPGGGLEEPAHDVEDGLVGPVQVRQHHHDRPAPGEGGRERQQGPGRLLAGASGIDAPADLVAEEVAQALDHPVDRGGAPIGPVQSFGHRGVDLARDDLLVLAPLDAAGGLDRARDRPPHVRLAVGHAAPGQDQGAVALPRLVRDVLGQAGLAEAGVAEREQQRGPAPVERHVQRVGQERDLVVAPDQGSAAAVRPVARREPGDLGHPGLHRGLPPLGGDGPQRAVGDHPAGREVGGLADQHLARLGHGLEALSRVHDVAHRRVVAAGPQRAHQDLARVDPHPQVRVEPQVGRRVAQRGGEP
jgi:hypothetical protein